MSSRAIDPIDCWVRHLVRCEETDPTATPVGGVFFGRDDAITGRDGLAGIQGWQKMSVTAVLDDDGAFTLELGNGVGSDGILHRDRFAVTEKNSEYEPGEEWIEVWVDAIPDRPLFVGTPTEGVLSGSAIAIKGIDVSALLAGVLCGDIEDWQQKAPVDVFRHYTRLPTMLIAEKPNVTLKPVGAEHAKHVLSTPAAMPDDCWTAETIVRVPDLTADPFARLVLAVGHTGTGVVENTFLIRFAPGNNFVDLRGPSALEATGSYLGGNPAPGVFALKLVAFYDHILGYINGELCVELRRPAEWMTRLSEVSVEEWGEILGEHAGVEVLAMRLEAPLPLAGVDDSLYDLHLPGTPPAEGIHTQVWSTAVIYSAVATQASRLANLWPILGEQVPAVDRIDPQIAFPESPEGPIAGARVARWSGAIYLDLAIIAEKLKFTGQGEWRVYLGRTMPGAEAITNTPGPGWGSGGSESGVSSGEVDLRSLLGEVSGWYPIVIEQATDAGDWTAILEIWDGAGWGPVPSGSLSPIGCYGALNKATSHRQLLGEVAQAFGYQWRNEPRSLESGHFPGQISARVLQGRQTAREITEGDIAESDEGIEATVQVVATDVVDGVIGDAAGIADPRGAASLSAEVLDYERALGHLAIRRMYESLAEITERPLLEARLNTLLALHSSPNEQVGVRPRAQIELVDSFPLTGELARMDWMVGDGARLRLDKLNVDDRSPRQLTTVTWPLTPDGLGQPTVGWRQRPRHPKYALRRLTNAIYGPRRTPQGNVAITTGSLGSTSGAMAPDVRSRAYAPPATRSIVLNVLILEGAGWEVECSPSGEKAGIKVVAPGRYDLTAAIKPASGGALGIPVYLWATLVGGSGSFLCQLEIQHRV